MPSHAAIAPAPFLLPIGVQMLAHLARVTQKSPESLRVTHSGSHRHQPRRNQALQLLWKRTPSFAKAVWVFGAGEGQGKRTRKRLVLTLRGIVLVPF